MKTVSRYLTKFAISLGVAALLTLSTAPAPAARADVMLVHPEVAYALLAEPGGVATSWSTAEWPALDMTLTVSGIGARSVGSCATGAVCAYSEPGQGGSKLQWTSCGSKSTAALALVGSIANARSSGTLQARQGTTVRASATAGTAATVPIAYRALITNVYC